MRFTALIFVQVLFLLMGFGTGCDSDLSPVDSGFDNEDVIGILISPEKVILPLGESVQLTATGLLENRTSRDLTPYVTWLTADASIAGVSNGLDQEGQVTGKAIGGTLVRAKLDEVTSTDVQIEVTEAELVGLAIEPKSITVQEGQSVQLKAIAAFSDGQRSDASSQVRWVTKDGSIAQLSSGGKLSGIEAGTTEIHVEWSGLTSDSVTVSVKKQQPPELVISEVSGESSDTLLSLTVEVKNEGDVGASDFFVDVFIDPITTPTVGDYGDDWIVVEYLGPAERVRHTFTFDLSRGTHDVYVLLDSLNHVKESNESNNVFGTTMDVGSGPSGPNLSFDRFEYLADSESVYYAIDVLNSGSEPVGPFYIDLFLDTWSQPAYNTDGDEFIDVEEGLEPGETLFADFFLDEPCSYCYSWIVVDSYDEIDETNEADNVAGPLYVIP